MTNLPPAVQAAVERAEAATQGPWTHRRQGYVDDERSKVQSTAEDLAIMAVTLSEEDQRANGEFMAYAREDIPMLAAGWAEDRAKLEAAKKLVRNCPPGHSVGDHIDWHERLDAILGGSE